MKLKNIEDIYELSHVQKGMLFHSISAPGSGFFHQQLQFTISGPLDVEAFERAWQQAVERHPVLRTSFFWEGLDKPMQVVRQTARVKVEATDWSDLPEAEHRARLRQHLDADRRRGFDLTRPPLMRLALFKLGHDTHRFVWSQHHLQLDGWSVPQLLGEVFLHYESLRVGSLPRLERPRPYRDYIAWLQRQSLRQAEQFWRERLRDFRAPTSFLVDRPAPADGHASDASGYAEQEARLGEEQTRRVVEAVRSRHLTVNAAVQGAWALLLSRYSGERDVLFGATVAGRPAELEGVERMLGLFVNTLPVRVRVDEEAEVGEWLGRLQAEGAEARQYEHSPLAEVLGWSEVPRGAPLFESVLAFENFPLDETLIGQVKEKTGLEISDFGSRERGDTPLAVVVFPERELILRMEYEQARFGDETIRRMLGHFKQLLLSISAGMRGRVAELTMMSDEERRRLLVEWNGAAARVPKGRCLHELFEERVEVAPDAEAVASERERLTFRELNERANQLARHLRAFGVGPEMRVGVMLERSTEMVVALVAILKAGGAYVPIDPEYPSERIAFMLEDARVRALVTRQELAERISPRDVQTVCLDRDRREIASRGGENVISGAVADNVAYVIYTSGSTGRPKGAAITHASLVNYVSIISRDFGLTADDSFAQLASPSFDVAVEEIFPVLVNGGRVVLCRDIPYAKDFLPLIRREGLTAFELPAAFWNEWVYELTHAGEQLPDCVRLVVLGTEKNLPERYAAWRQVAGPNTTLVHVYGLTETTITSTTYKPSAETVERDTKYPLPIGRPLPNTKIYLLDARLRPVPQGVAGELYIGGVGVGRGYHDRPALTAERFVPDPISAEPGARLYRTGDLARYLEDGQIEFLRRIDEQVKVRGYRIELAEIEAALAEHPAVREAVVAVREDAPGQKRLVAYVTPGAGYAAAPDGLRRTDEGRVELWPSHGEYPVYDDLLYRAMAEDALRNEGYREALASVMPGKVAVDVGTGAELVLARMCVEAGARKVYAVEVLEESFRRAKERVRELGLEDRIELVHADATTLQQLSEPADVCVSELIGCIGGSEGAVAILNHARRWLNPGGTMIPARCVTRVAAVTLPDEVHRAPAFEELGAHYAEQVFAAVGHRDDVRLCVRNFPPDHLLSEGAVFEDLDFGRRADPAFSREVELRVERGGRLDGLLFWIQLSPGGRVAVDSLRDECAWLPMFFPVFYPGVEVGAGDVLRFDASGEPAEAGTYPDYHLRGVLRRADGRGQTFAFDSFWKKRPSSPNALHRRLVSANGVEVRKREDERLTSADLRAHLSTRLPNYMLPSAFVMLDAIPVTTNGKIDRKALPAPNAAPAATPETNDTDLTPAEQTLSRIWAEVLGMPEVGLDDNFFELGGDSILTIQVMARANKAGLRLVPRHLFEHQTIAELAAAADAQAEASACDETRKCEVPAKVAATGGESVPAEREVPLTPIQQWFFAQDFAEPHHWNQSLLLEPRRPLRRDVLARVLGGLVRRHEALRLRFRRDEKGVWRQLLLSAEALSGTRPPVHEVDLSLVSAEERARLLERCCARAQRSLDLDAGPLLRLVLFTTEGGVWQRLLAAAHHLVVDGVSWRVLVAELQKDYERAGASAESAPAAGSFAAWAERLQADADSPESASRDAYWEAAERAAREFQLPSDVGDPASAINDEGSAASLTISLAADETRALLREVPRAYRSRIQDALLAALGRALSRWTGRPRVAVWLEGHGREPLGASSSDGAAAETVGWFTALYPVAVEAEWEDAGAALVASKEALRGVPDGGVGYGLRRYVRQANRNGHGPRAEQGGVAFNYHGQLDQVLEESSLLTLADDPSGPAVSPRAARSFHIEINAAVINGQLQLTWNYSRNLHRRETIEAVAADYSEALREIVGHCGKPGVGAFTPSDFPSLKLTQSELDELSRSDRRVEDIQPLSPMQEGMIFHRLYNPESGDYLAQFIMTLRGQLDESAFEQAWRGVVERHAMLRTDFVTGRRDEPLQIVHEQVSIPWQREDWSELTQAEQEERLQAYLRDDRRRGFELTRAPLMRLLLVRTSADQHRVVWTLAMMLLDGWSVSQLLKEVFLHYESLRVGSRPRLERPRPYRDYIAWLQRQPLEPAERFWRERLRGFRAPTTLSVERPASAGGHDAGPGGLVQLEARLGEEQTRRVVEAVRSRHLTVNAAVQGAWALLLSRYSGERDVLFGATVAGRPAELEGVERMLGLFVNTLPVRVRVDEEAEVGEWLGRLQAEGAEARQYEHSPVVDVTGWSEVPRGAPLFESLLAFDNYPFDAALSEQVKAKTGLDVTELRVLEQTNFPLFVTVMPGGELTLLLRYERERFDDETARRMLRHLECLLEAVADGMHRRVGELRALTAPEDERFLAELNDTRAELPSDLRLHQLVEQQAELRPDKEAVWFGGEGVSYAELNRRANRLAHGLRGMGVGADVLVGVCLERSVEMVVALLGILKAGGAYVPIDPEYPEERRAYMIEDSRAEIVLTQRRFADDLRREGVRVIALDAPEGAFAEEADDNPRLDLAPRNLAYMIYTSGSTGRPKGAMNSHEAIINRLLWMRKNFQLTEHDRVVQKTPFSFDVSVWEFFWPLICGATLVVAEPGGHRDSAYLARLIAGQKVTAMHFVPSMLQPFLEEPEAARCSSLKRVFCSGEALPFELQRRFFERFDAELHNLYGPTEAAVEVTYWRCAPDSTLGVVPIGRPIDNVQVYILDERLRPLPTGVTGELFLGGICLARGYHSRPGLTAERFVPHPLSDVPGQRLYRTGDLARLLPSGDVEFLGRLDNQVKLRGFRIELGEVEAALLSHARVRDAVALMREDAPGDRRLAAYFVAAKGEDVTGAELREHLKEKLPEYMVPTSFVSLEALPLTPNGKVDRKQLPAPDAAHADPSKEYAAPMTPSEELLAGILSQVLGVERVGVDDDFFELGGHSLHATQVVSRVRQAFEVDLPLRKLFESPTVAGLAEAVARQSRDAQAESAETIGAAPRGVELPLSFAQQRLWFLYQLEPSSAIYNSLSALLLEGTLDLRLLRRTLDEVVRRHEVLRTTFAGVAGRPVQLVGEATRQSLPVVDLTALSQAARERAVRRLAREEAGRPFDLSRGPLLRATLLRTAAREYVALLTMHHIVSDGWSMGVLVREVAALYEAFVQGHDSPLAELPIQYADYAVWQRGHLQGEVLERQLSYWRRQLAGAPPVLELPTDKPRPSVQSYRGSSQSFAFSPDLLEDLKALSRREDVTLFMTLLAAFQLLLSRYAGQEDVTVGTAIANRTRGETEGLIGFFVNTLVLRTDLTGNVRFTELLRRVREVCLGAYAHQEIPFERLVEELRPERSPSHSPLFQVAFGLNNAPQGSLTLPGLRLSALEIEDEVVRFDLTLWVVESPDGLQGRWTYRTELFESATVERMTRHWETLLRNIVAAPETRLRSLEMLMAEEIRQKELEERAREAVTAEKLLTTKRKSIRVAGEAS